MAPVEIAKLGMVAPIALLCLINIHVVDQSKQLLWMVELLDDIGIVEHSSEQCRWPTTKYG